MLSQVERGSEGALLEILLSRGHLAPSRDPSPWQPVTRPTVMPASQTFLPVFSHVLACTCCLPLPSSHPSSVSHSMTRHIRRVSAPANPHVHLTLAPRPGPWGPPFPPPGEPGVRGIQQGNVRAQEQSEGSRWAASLPQ